MFQDPVVTATLSVLPNKEVFMRPMSRKARALLGIIIDWLKNKPGMLAKFANVYDPIVFEEACHRYDTYKYKELLKDVKAKTEQEILDVATLKNLKNHEWSERLAPNTHRAGLISNPRSAEVYRWLTTNFLLMDFSPEDLNKVAFLGEYALEHVKQTARNIKDKDKHSIGYLYAIVIDEAEKNKVIASQADLAEKQYVEKIQRIIDDAAIPRQIHKFDGDEEERWAREREYLDYLKNG